MTGSRVAGVGNYAMKNNLLVISAVTAALAVAACESTGSRNGAPGGLAASDQYAPGDRLYRHNRVEELYARETTLEQARLRELAAYKGIEGARLAHRLFRGSHAEALDGDCERQIVVGQNETLWDISELCDVSIFTLTDYNTNVDNPRHVFEGQVLFVPHANAFGDDAFISASFDQGVDGLPLSPLLDSGSVYHAASGDTLSTIATRHNVSAASLANLNPGVDWTKLDAGAPIKLPASKLVAPAAPKPTSASSALERSQRLDLNRTAVEPGGVVRIAAHGLPAKADVMIYRGPNRRSLEFVGTFRTDENGDLFASAAVQNAVPMEAAETDAGEKAIEAAKARRDVINSGGVVFAAAVEGDYIFSPRVSVLKLRNELQK